MGEFIYHVDFVVLETESVANSDTQIPVIVGRSFLATSNALIEWYAKVVFWKHDC